MIKNYFRILKKPHAYLQTILKTPVKFQKDRTETVGGVKGTKYLLKTRNHAPRATRHAPRPMENQKQCPSTFLRKGGEQQHDLLPYRGQNVTITTIFDLITAHTSISAQSSNFVIFRLQPMNLYLLLHISFGNSNEYQQHMLLKSFLWNLSIN